MNTETRTNTSVSAGMPRVTENGVPRILIVEDEDSVAALLQRALSETHYLFQRARNGEEAMSLFKTASFDAIVSDLGMPGMNGIQLIKAVREHDADVPFVIVTGKPEVETAITAVEYGAVRYLVKPVRLDELREAVVKAVEAKTTATMYRRAVAMMAEKTEAAHSMSLRESDFRRALETLHLAYQPIVHAKRNTVVGYEALVRTRDETLFRPADLLGAAEDFGAIPELGRRVRETVARTIGDFPKESLVFVNLHPLEILDEQLYSTANPLRTHASRVVFEVTEQARLGPVDRVDARFATLRSLGFLLAVDDLGAGYSALTNLIRFDPDFAKIDMGLVQGADKSPSQRVLIASLVKVCKELRVQLVCEGIETEAEANTLLDLGAELLQGYYFARPSSFDKLHHELLVKRIERFTESRRETAGRSVG